MSDADSRWVPPTPGDTIDEGRSFSAVARALFKTAPTAPCVGRYYLLERIGQGGMGVVYVGYDPTLERRVAIKFLKDRKRGGERLLEEGRALANLVHPNVVAVHEVAEDGDGVYLVMAHIEGQTLDAWLRASPRSWREILRVLTDAGRGLAAVHAAGLAHRDVKPSNLLIDARGVVRVADFGLAVRVDGGDVDARGGTEAYMAPEQVEGEGVGPAADQYGLCVCLLEALTGTRDVQGDLDQWERDATQRDPDGQAPPTSVFEAIGRGLKPAPKRRHPSMEALLEGLEVHTATPRHPATWIAGGLVLGMVGLAAGLAVAPEPLEAAEPPPPCVGVEGTFFRTRWTPSQREGVVTPKRAADPLWSLTLGALDGYARRWDGVHLAGCKAHADGTLSPVGLDDRNRCLARLGRDFDTTVDLLREEASIAGTRASEVVEDLPDPATCELPRSVLELTLGGVDDGEATPAEASLEEDVAAEWVRFHLGLEVGPEFASFERRVDEVGDQALRADTYRLLAERGETLPQKHRFVDLALASAFAGRAHVMLTATLIDQGRMHDWSGKLELAQAYFELADASAVAVEELARDFPGLDGHARRLRGQLGIGWGNLKARDGDYVQALVHQRSAIDYFQSADVPQPLAEAKAWNNVARAHQALGDLDAADTAYTKALDLARPLVPRDNLMLALIYNNRGSNRQDRGDWKGARLDYAKVLPRDGKPTDRSQGLTVFNLALMEAARGDLNAAAHECRLARAALQGEPPDVLMQALFDLHCVAFAVEAGSDREDAIGELRRLYDAFEAVANNESGVLILAHLRMARAMLHLQRPKLAAGWIERSRVSLEGSQALDRATVDTLEGHLATEAGLATEAYRRAVARYDERGFDTHPRLVEPLLGLAQREPSIADAGRALGRAETLIEQHDLHASVRERARSLRDARGLP